MRAVSSIPKNLLPLEPPIPTDVGKLSYTSRYACQRASPLVCPNQALVRALDTIRQSRALEGEDRSALSYERAASVIKCASTVPLYEYIVLMGTFQHIHTRSSL